MPAGGEGRGLPPGVRSVDGVGDGVVARWIRREGVAYSALRGPVPRVVCQLAVLLGVEERVCAECWWGGRGEMKGEGYCGWRREYVVSAGWVEGRYEK